MAAATEILPDAEREAIIRERLRLHPRHRCQCDACVLSRRLDEALALDHSLGEAQAEIARLNDLLDGAEKQIDRMADERVAAVAKEREACAWVAQEVQLRALGNTKAGPRGLTLEQLKERDWKMAGQQHAAGEIAFKIRGRSKP